MTQHIQDIPLAANSVASIDGVGCAEGSAFANSNNLDRALAAMVRNEFAAMQTTVTAAALATISGIGQFVPMAGATTITAFDTAVTGLFREVYASSTLIFGPTTALGLQANSGNVTLVPGDRLRARSLGAGTWASKVDAPTGIADLAVTTAKLAANAVTFAKMQAITDGKLLGASGGTAVEEITVGTGLTLAANTLSATATAGVIHSGAYTANADLSTLIPFDDTIPTSSEGTSIISFSVTTTTATQVVVVDFNGVCGISSGSGIVALFRDTTCIGASCSTISQTPLPCLVVDSPGAAGTYTYSARVGGSSGTIRMNGSTGARFFGGAAKTTLTAQVWEP